MSASAVGRLIAERVLEHLAAEAPPELTELLVLAEDDRHGVVDRLGQVVDRVLEERRTLPLRPVVGPSGHVELDTRSGGPT